MIRLSELGVIILIENVYFERSLDENNEEVVTEGWRVVGKVTGKNRWHEAHVELTRLNKEIAEAVRASRAAAMAGSAGSV